MAKEKSPQTQCTNDIRKSRNLVSNLDSLPTHKMTTPYTFFNIHPYFEPNSTRNVIANAWLKKGGDMVS